CPPASAGTPLGSLLTRKVQKWCLSAPSLGRAQSRPPCQGFRATATSRCSFPCPTVSRTVPSGTPRSRCPFRAAAGPDSCDPLSRRRRSGAEGVEVLQDTARVAGKVPGEEWPRETLQPKERDEMAAGEKAEKGEIRPRR